MKRGERQRLYRSCCHLIVLLLALLSGERAAHAQHHGDISSSDGCAFGGDSLAHRAGAAGSFGWRSAWNGGAGGATGGAWSDPGRCLQFFAQGDTMITPGSRDFLEPNAPNPFGVNVPSTRIGYALSEESHVTIKVYDFFYEEVVTLVDEVRPAGYHSVTFIPPPTMPSGMYFYEMTTGRSRELRRMMYMK